jgi:mannose PTS system EIIA component
MDPMVGMMIIAHAPLASSLKTVAEHVFADCCSGLQTLDVTGDMSIDQVEAAARAMLDALRASGASEVLVFADVFGATPCNVALRIGDGVRVRVVAGVNVPMLWRSLDHRNESLDAVVGWAVSGGTQGVIQFTATKPQNQTLKSAGHDQDKHHHHQ